MISSFTGKHFKDTVGDDRIAFSVLIDETIYEGIAFHAIGELDESDFYMREELEWLDEQKREKIARFVEDALIEKLWNLSDLETAAYAEEVIRKREAYFRDRYNR